MIWTQEAILKQLRRLHKSGRDLSYNRASRQIQPLVSASAYHFGSYRAAIEAAGIDYADILRRPRWTPARIVALIRASHRKGIELSWSAVIRRRDEVRLCAFASLQPRLFGTWEKALRAAGVSPADVTLYRSWDRKAVSLALRQRATARKPLNSGTVQREDPRLHAAAIRYFDSYDLALKSAKVSPDSVRQRRSWSRQQVIDRIRSREKSLKKLSDGGVRQDDPALYGASMRFFGSFRKARQAAGVEFARGTKRSKNAKRLKR